MSSEAVIKWLLPFEKTENGNNAGTIFEPDHLTVLNLTVREYVAGILTACARESFACEVAARRMAMDSAGKNAKQMIDDLSLEYNRARQGAITQEITEIVAGSGN
jgi:F-type H+-transporting ATPase subunit gamma